jgi:aerobic carbon-monoxide dehydrogenase medium subunit
MQTFNYAKATSLADAVQRLRASPDGRALAGGMTLLPTMKLRLAQPADIVALSGLAELRGIRRSGDRLTIGAMTRYADIAASADVRGSIPALAVLVGSIGDRQVRNRGTLGGSVAANDPAADCPAAVLGLDAVVHTDRRAIPVGSFFTGLFSTALAPGELIKAIEFRIPKRAGYAKFPSPASRYALVGVLVADFGSEVRVAVTGAGPCVFRAQAFESALKKHFAPESLDGLAVPATDLNHDIHASAAYRAHLVGVMARRAVVAAGR